MSGYVLPVLILLHRFSVPEGLILEGPTFVEEPPGHVGFINTQGTEIRCRAQGLPAPSVQWLLQDSRPVSPVPQLLEVKEDGTLVFLPFLTEDYRSEIHDTIYRCTARNVIGVVSSREVRLRAALMQDYEVQVYDQYAIYGTTTVFRCHVKSPIRDYIRVTEWKINDNLTITASETEPNVVDKYVAFPTGELHVHQVTHSDGHSKFKCKTVHKLTGDRKISKAGGRIVVTEPVGGMSPKIIHSKPKVWATHGQTVMLPCAAQGQPPPNYTWVRKEKGRNTMKNRIQQSIHGTLKIPGVIAADSGRYICYVNNSQGTDTAETELVVTVPVKVNIDPHRLVVLTGESATLTCNQVGHPIDSVLWMKDLHHLTEDGRVQFVGRNVLHIPIVWKKDQGMYQCFVYSSGTTEQAIAQLTVGDIGPVLHDTFGERIVHPGQSVSFRCMASGHPLPEITWYVNRQPIVNEENLKVSDYVTSQGQVVSMINLTDVTVNDSGLYECMAQSSVGRANHVARLNVYGPPGIRPMANVTVIEGQNLYLECPVTGYPLDSITWEKGGIELPLARRHYTYPNGTLLVQEVQKDYDQGSYTCVVRSQGISQKRSVAVIITKPPKIIPFETPRVREGTLVVLTCAINQGDPPFDLQWFKNGQSVIAEIGLTVQRHDMFSILVFSEVKRHHAGNYTCLAKNAGGSASHSALLIVDVPPHWLIEPENASVILGQSITLDCKAEGLPPPTIVWKKSQGIMAREFEPVYNSYNYILYGNGSLGIREVESANSGYYLCQANNNVGAAISKLVTITVHTPPQFETEHTVETFRLHSSLELLCSASGELPLEVTWSKDGVTISNRTDDTFRFGFQEINTGIEATLIKSKVVGNDSGLYACTVGNAYGVSEATFQVIVQEAPASPSNIEVVAKTGRSLTISWQEPFGGHSAITGYIVLYKIKGGDKWQNISISGISTTATISGLQPATYYILRVLAENAIGKSNLSKIITTSTDEEVPGGPPLRIKASPTGPNSIKVSWEPPNKSLWNGNITGYFIGYKILSSNDQALFKTINLSSGKELEVHLTNLRRSTKYSVSVQAFNGKGTGPRSDELVVQTLADVPPTAPFLHIVTSTTSSITLSWSHKRTFSSPVKECVLHHKREYGEWKETKVITQTSTYTISSLDCGTRYQFFMVCHNSVGRSEPSEIVQATTSGAAPVSPSKEDFVQPNSTSSILHLSSWQNGGCPIKEFTLKLKPKYKSQWSSLETKLPSDQSKYVIQSLTPGTWYSIKVTAYSSAGATEAQYEFQTSNETEVIEIHQPQSSELAPFYLEITFLIPVITSSVIVIIIIIVGCVLCRRRNSHRSTISSDGSGSSKSRQGGLEAMALKDITNNGSNQQPIGISGDDVSRPVSSVVPITGMAGTREETHCYATPYDTIPEMSVGDQTPISIVRTLNRPTVRDKKGDNLYITRQLFQDRPYEALKADVQPPFPLFRVEDV
ncbi:Down syndrome cell adhesion molecule-like protein Dscam2 isoform X2 [Centruroides sculpturatus]|uniref:Down syndrome cell adhesion molecule-like protein Dscam2 isoform X2 n=1 Tax=Centruroides sculpturatus TaxID=218467 RepID=UPI000C6DAE66|nr:Down syndrome cell adhesion molecule-like protein Dscam2 isoform X2 [Centruroides sculpturatus]